MARVGNEGSAADVRQDKRLAKRLGKTMAQVEGTREDEAMDAQRQGGKVSQGGRGNRQMIAGTQRGGGMNKSMAGGSGGAGGLAFHGSMSGAKMQGREPRHTSKTR